MAFPIGAALGVLKGGYDFFSNKSKEDQAIREIQALKDPFYKIQDEYIQNRDIGASIASQGLTSGAKDYYTTEAQRGLGGAIGAIEQGGGTPSDLANLFGVYDRAITKTAAMDAEAKLNNLGIFMNVNKDLAGQKNIQWSLNEDQPYQRKLKELTQRRAAAEQNQNTGLNTAISSISSWETANQNAKLFNQLFGNNAPTISSTAPAHTAATTDIGILREGAESGIGQEHGINPNTEIATQLKFPIEYRIKR